ncbi:MAG TPA: alkaline phosphatase [Verrucomicrobiales bacterium]|nr:alkaline phosphatase [Verrucomicrobiales bacterium]
MKPFPMLLLGLGLTCGSALIPAAAQPAPAVRHVIVIGVDGMSPDGVRKAATPAMDRLMREGAWTLGARAVMPTSSSPNWASMIMGASPEEHGITSNDWQPDKFDIAPTARGPGGIFPTIFSVLRGQRSDAVTGVFHDWGGFGRLFERELVSRIEDTDGPTNAVRQAMAWFREARPTLLFIHLDHVDHAGHDAGHGTPEYYASVEVADRLIGEVLAVLEELRALDHSLVLVTSDHGGINKGHGGATMAEIEIPWIVRGPGVRRGHELQVPVNTADTAATVAFALRLKAPAAWSARPVVEAFEPR